MNQKADVSDRSYDNMKLFSSIKRVAKEASGQFIPVIFAVFINLLDACTFGTVFFPSKLGSNLSGLAIELFLLSTVVVQVVLVRMSSFNCGMGTSMAENIPFIHTMATGIFDTLESTHTIEQMMPTVLFTVCLSTVINGVLFFIVGYFHLGSILHFFPRHVILGMTAGFGVFLLSTAIESSTGIVMADHVTPFSFLNALSPSRSYQLGIVVVFELILRLVEHLKFNEVVVPCLLFLLPLSFYLVLAMTSTSFQQARMNGWMFPLTPTANWWDTWKLFDFSSVSWTAVAGQWTTMASLAFFTLILVPIRIPSLSIITGEEVNFDEELKAQGVANILSGLFGAVHNYLSYSNSIFFFVVGGKGKLSQGAVTLLTLLLFFIGPQLINYVPRMIAGVIMLHLGVDLLIGGLITSRKALDSLEYTSVVFITCIVSILGFVYGIGFGVLSACLTFVVQSSRQSSIRAVFSGDTARSNTSWSSRQRELLDVGLLGGNSIFVIQLQGNLYFGNVQQVVDGIMNALSHHNFSTVAVDEAPAPVTKSKSSSGLSPQVKNIILDCSFVTGADVNAISGLLKMKDRISAEYNSSNLLKRTPSSKGLSQVDALERSKSSDSKIDVDGYNREIKVRVIFAGLQESLEVMFAEQQKIRQAKENEKEGIRSDLSDTRRNHIEGRGDPSTRGRGGGGRYHYRDRNHGEEYKDLEMNCNDNNEKYGTNVTRVTATTVSEIQSFSDQEESNYLSAHTYDSISSDSDTEIVPSAIIAALENIKDSSRHGNLSVDETNDVSMRKKNSRSPSFGSTPAGNIVGLKSSGNSSSRNSSSDSLRKFPHPISITERMLKSTQEETKSAENYASLHNLPAPIPAHPSLLSRVMDYDENTKLVEKRVVPETLTSRPLHYNSISQSHDPPLQISPKRLLPASVTDYILPTPRSVPLPQDPSVYLHSTSSRPSRGFYSDVNTALQAVEEKIIKSTPMPKVRKSSFYTRRPSLNGSGIASSHAAELRREDIVHSPLDDKWADFQRTQSPLTLWKGNVNHPLLRSNDTSENASDIVFSFGDVKTESEISTSIPSPPRPIPHSPLSPHSRELKIKITNMLFDLSSQWTYGDSPALKRLARRLRKGVIAVKRREILWESGQEAMQMGMLLSGRLKAVLRSDGDSNTLSSRTLQVILPGTIFGELGLLSRGRHSRTIIASADSRIAMLSRDTLDDIEETDKLTLQTAAGRSNELMLFNAGSLGP